MKSTNSAALCFALASLALPSTMLADFQYQETTQITGGSTLAMMKMAARFSKTAREAGEPIVSEVLVKGNRMARIDKDATVITDLNAETITTIDNIKHEYSVVTFEQMRQQIEKAMHDAQERMKQDKSKPAQPDPTTDVKFSVKVRNTGATKPVAGVNASESILSMTMDATDKDSGQTGGLAMTNDMWMAEDIPGYDEIRDFERRYALKMRVIFSGAINPSMMAAQPAFGQGMAAMVKEMSKLKGVPVQQIMRTGATANGEPLPAASEAPLPPDNSPPMPSAGDVAQQSATSTITSKLTGFGFGGFGHKKKADPPPADAPPPTAAQTAAASVLVESTTEYTTLSPAPIDGSRFDVPAGFKMVDRKFGD